MYKKYISSISRLMQEKSPKIRISVVHVKGARGLLDWTIADLAEHSSVAVQTITNWENRKTQPRESTREAIHDAFVKAGIEFTNGGDPGVKLIRSKKPAG